MNLFFHPGTAVGTVQAPPSKSQAHRLLIASALAGETAISLPEEDFCDDLRATEEALKVWRQASASAVFPCRESATTLRLMMPLALTRPGRYRFEGTPALMRRGVSAYEAIFREKGIRLTGGTDFFEAEGSLPAGDYCVDASLSSQFVSGLLFALPLLSGDSTLRLKGPAVSRPYIDLTLDVLARAGIVVREEAGVFHLSGGQRYAPIQTEVEGDYSNAAFLDAFNRLGGEVEVTGLQPDSLQGDRIYPLLFDRLKAGDATPIDLSHNIDLGPVLFVLAAALHGGTFTGTRRLAFKESDRIGALLAELSEFGANFAVSDDAVRIFPAPLHAPSRPLSGHGDHRTVMALSVLLTRFGGRLEGAEAVSKSFPAFFDRLRQLRLNIEEVR